MPNRRTTFMGDSKTASMGFQGELLDLIHGEAVPTQLATGGWHVAELLAATDAWLAGAVGTPNYVLINIGINDITHGTSEASYKADLASVLDKVHAQWGSAIILIARPWKVGADTECAAMAGWIDTVLSTRVWATVGLDEQVTLKGSDNGAAEMTGDGTHPTALGYHLTALAWKTAMGL